MATKRAKKPAEGPRSLASIQVDVSTRLGAAAPATTTGMASLDQLLGGGLRSGTHLLISGAPGTGKTALALMLAYMAARAKASVLYASVGLDDTEVMSRLAARALHREYQNVTATYGTIWSGLSLQDPALRAPISGCMNGVVKKVGEHLHLLASEPMDDVSVLSDHAGYLWARNERVLVVVDGVEAYTGFGAGANVSFDARMSLVAYELSRLASQGCAVITTCQAATAAMVAPAATVFAELVPARDPVSREKMKKKFPVDSRAMDLTIVKNRLGPTPAVPLVYLAAASVFEEREP